VDSLLSSGSRPFPPQRMQGVPLVTMPLARGLTIRLAGVALLARTHDLERPGNPANPSWLGMSGSRALPETLTPSRPAVWRSDLRPQRPEAHLPLAAGQPNRSPSVSANTTSRIRLRAERRHCMETNSRSYLRTGLEFDSAGLGPAIAECADHEPDGEDFAGLPGSTTTGDATPSPPCRATLSLMPIGARKSSFVQRIPEPGLSIHRWRIPNIVTPADTAFNTADGHRGLS
jgi:hypothetical protein